MPVAIPAVAGFSFLILVAFVVMLGLRQSGGGFAGALANGLRAIPIIGGYIARATEAAIAAFTHLMEKAFGETGKLIDSALGGFFEGMATVIELAAYAEAHVAAQLTHAIRLLRQTIIPLMIRYAVAPVLRLAHTLVRPLTVVYRITKTSTAALTKAIGAVEALAAAAYAAAAGAIEHLPPLSLPLSIPNLWKWIREHEKLIFGGTIAGIAAAVLARGLPWYKCSNVNRTMRQLCRTPRWHLDSLLSLLADVLIVRSICQVIPLMEQAWETVAAPAVSEIAALSARLCGQPPADWKPLDVPALHLPPAQDVHAAIGG